VAGLLERPADDALLVRDGLGLVGRLAVCPGGPLGLLAPRFLVGQPAGAGLGGVVRPFLQREDLARGAGEAGKGGARVGDVDQGPRLVLVQIAADIEAEAAGRGVDHAGHFVQPGEPGPPPRLARVVDNGGAAGRAWPVWCAVDYVQARIHELVIN